MGDMAGVGASRLTELHLSDQSPPESVAFSTL